MRDAKEHLTAGLSRRKLLKSAAMTAVTLPAALTGRIPEAQAQIPAASGSHDRRYWVELMSRVAEPVLHALSEGKLKVLMPVEALAGHEKDRRQYTHLEAMGRLLAGMAPWIESGQVDGEEGKLHNRYAEWARMGIIVGTDPKSPDFMNFNKGGQPVVDAAFLALAILRAPNELWQKLDVATQRNLVAALESTRVIQPGYSNWLLFSATIEAALSMMGVSWDPMRVDYAVRSLDSWYKGDGVYGDGPEFHWDYYNSFVMHPMLLAVLDAVSKVSPSWNRFREPVLERARRYAAIQERMIAPDASFPPVGRSLSYRFGAFHLLADMALRGKLPEGVHPAQVRCALTAVMCRMADAPGTFDENGWLRIGFYGHQPSIAESYISTGSCYLCSAAWLPLGLSASDPFWAADAMPWTAKRVWSGEAVAPDHAQT
jgi:hypothetical protein